MRGNETYMKGCPLRSSDARLEAVNAFRTVSQMSGPCFFSPQR